MTRTLIALALLPLAGCTIDVKTNSNCVVENPQGYIGQLYSNRIADRIKDLSRAAHVRAIRPGEMVTMEFKANRVNVVLDENNKVTRIYCG